MRGLHGLDIPIQNNAEHAQKFEGIDPRQGGWTKIAIFGGSALLFHPEVYVEESTEKALSAHTSEDGRIAAALPHISGSDIFHHASVVHIKEYLRQLEENLAILGKIGLFNVPIIGSAITENGAVSTTRWKDLKKDLGRDPTLEEDVKRKEDNQPYTQIVADRVVEKGSNFALYINGARKDEDKDDQTILSIDDIKPGFLEVIGKLKKPDEVMVFTIALNYRGMIRLPVLQKKIWDPRDVIAYIDYLPAEETDCLNEDKLHKFVQGAITRAAEIRKNRLKFAPILTDRSIRS